MLASLLALLASHPHLALDAAVQLLQVVTGPPVVFGSSNGDGGGSAALLLAGPVSGVALYAGVYRYYRNADKTHHFETETLIALKQDISGRDEKVDEVRGTRDRRIRGDNGTDFRRRVDRLD